MSVRIRRLKADYNKMSSIFTQETAIKIKKVWGDPPEKYEIEFAVPGLKQDLATGKIQKAKSFTTEITLTRSYPRTAPLCRMVTPIFHPNIAPHAICIGDHWAAGESLTHIIIRIAEMIVFQSYNIKSPLNGEAAKWVERNENKLPLSTFDFSSLTSKGEILGRNSDGTLKTDNRCSNCGTTAGSFEVCLNQHVTCENCKIHCPICQKTMCLTCSRQECSFCHSKVCGHCAYKCNSCQRMGCKKHIGGCIVCRKGYCGDCMVVCSGCKKHACVNHIGKAVVDNQKQYLCNNCNV